MCENLATTKFTMSQSGCKFRKSEVVSYCVLILIVFGPTSLSLMLTKLNISGLLLLFCVYSCRVSVSSCPTARQLSRVSPVDVGFLREEAAVLGDAIKRTLRIICPASLFCHMFLCTIIWVFSFVKSGLFFLFWLG